MCKRSIPAHSGRVCPLGDVSSRPELFYRPANAAPSAQYRGIGQVQHDDEATIAVMKQASDGPPWFYQAPGRVAAPLLWPPHKAVSIGPTGHHGHWVSRRRGAAYTNIPNAGPAYVTRPDPFFWRSGPLLLVD